ncbi:MAG: MucB/RseB C-terminal domain-containing protein [Arenicellales bacterium]
MSSTIRFILLAAALFTVALFNIAGAANAKPMTGEQWLQEMSVAADTLNYSGEFVLVKGGQLSSLEINHMQGKGGSLQKIMSLNGSMREIIQKEDEIACVLPDEGMGVKEKKQSKALFNVDVSQNLERISAHYVVEKLGDSRVANRDCKQLKISAKDQYRYGYLLCIDLETYLLLRSELIGVNEQVLESYMFVDVEFNQLTENDFHSGTDAKSLKWMSDQKADSKAHEDKRLIEAVVEQVTVDQAHSAWTLQTNPTGFEIEQTIERMSPVLNADITHLVLSDGLAKVSVFITPAQVSLLKNEKVDDSIQMGSLNSHIRQIDAYNITAIGEVPLDTVKLLAEQVSQ